MMTQNIADTIRHHRKRLGLTQEQLAERVGVSFQAVSKWECGTATPDLSMIVVLANFFDITTDTLLGVDIAKKKECIDAILAEYNRLSNLGKEKEQFDYICAAYRDYPGDNRILDKYLWELCYDPYCDCDGLLVHEEEITALCTRVMNECIDDEVRYSAISIMCGLYRDKGDIPRAKEMIARLPRELQGEETECLYSSSDSDEWWSAIRENVNDLTSRLYIKLRNQALHAPVSHEEHIRLLKKAEKLLQIIYDEGDYGFANYHLGELYLWIANRYRVMGDDKHCAEYLKRGLSFVHAYDMLPEEVIHTSHAVRGCIFRRAEVSSGFEGNDMKRELGYLASFSIYDDVRDAEWYREIIAQFAPFASDTK